MACPVVSSSEMSATHTYAVAALAQLKQLKQEADEWAATVGRLLGLPGNGEKEEEPPVPGVVSSDMG